MGPANIHVFLYENIFQAIEIPETSRNHNLSVSNSFSFTLTLIEPLKYESNDERETNFTEFCMIITIVSEPHSRAN